MAVTVDSLISKYHISRDACNKRVSDLHIIDISLKHCRKWRDLPNYLGIDKIAVSDLEYAPGSESDKRTQFFNRWQQEKGRDATYRSLLAALLKVQSREDDAESREDVEFICTLLKDDNTSASSCSTNGAPPGNAATSNGKHQYQRHSACLKSHIASG